VRERERERRERERENSVFKKEILPYRITWMNLDDTKLNEISQTQ